MKLKRPSTIAPQSFRIAGTVALLLLAFVPRVWNIAYGDLSFDEIATVFISRRSLLEVLRYISGAVREHPPLYYLLMSVWFRLVGTSEFVARYPSALIGVLSVAYGFRFARRLLRRGRPEAVALEAGIWTAVLLAIMPFSVWAGRTARMYSLVVLLALVIMERWYCWSLGPSRRGWFLFAGASLAGMLTHYYLLFLWVVQGSILLFFPRRTRGIRTPWVATITGGLSALAVGIALAPGVRNTLFETGSRFPALPLRWRELQAALMELLLNRSHPDLWVVTAIGLLIVIAGWLMVWRGSRSTALWLMLWVFVPTAAVILIPEAIHGRYIIVVLPALAMGLAGLVTLLRPHAVRLLLLLIVLAEVGVRWGENLVAPGQSTFSEQVALLRDLAAPDDAVVLNNPWISLLLTYYTLPDNLDSYAIPASAPPGFNSEEDLPKIEKIAQKYERLWVTYDAVTYSDPRYQLSRWLAESWYNVHEFGNLALYLPRPFYLTIIAEDIPFGPDLQLRRAGVDQIKVGQGEPIRVHLEWLGEALSWKTQLTLGLLGADGRVWTAHEFNLGPVRQDEFSTLPERWIERRGLWVRPGVPPGTYELVLKVVSTDREIVMPPETNVEGWYPLTEVHVSAPAEAATTDPGPLGPERVYLPLVMKNAQTSPSDLIDNRPVISIPQWAEARAVFGEKLALVGLRPKSEWVGQGYPMELSLYWQALTELPEIIVKVRLVGPDTLFRAGSATEAQPFALGPDFYPASSWQETVVVEQDIKVPLPRDLDGGIYHVQVQVTDNTGSPWEVSGSRRALVFEEYLLGREQLLQGEWADLFTIEIRARQRTSHPPLFSKRVEYYFGDVLRLRAYRLSTYRMRAGETATLTLYWQAQRAPTQIYAAFNHLLSDDGMPIWTQDSWPQNGTYTTDRWAAGEVVAETYTLQIPESTAPGDYTLHVGIYDPESILRLPARDREANPILNDAVPLLEVTVMP